MSLEQQLSAYKKLESDLQQVLASRQTLETQFQENKIVKEEFDKLKEGAKIYKLIGPVLMPQDEEEAKMNVGKRLDFITGEIERAEKKIKDGQEQIQKAQGEIVEARTKMIEGLKQ